MSNILELLDNCNDADVNYEVRNARLIEDSYQDVFAPFLRFEMIGFYEENMEKWKSLIKEYSSDYIPHCEKYLEEIEKMNEQETDEEDEEDDIEEDDFNNKF